MDVFKIGLRNILGLTMPGAVIVLVSYYVLIRFVILFGLRPDDYFWGKDQQFTAFAVLFAISFVIGASIRLKAADIVDRKSSKKLLREYRSIFAYSTEAKKALEDAKRAFAARLIDRKNYKNRLTAWTRLERRVFSASHIDFSKPRSNLGKIYLKFRELLGKENLDLDRKNDFRYAFDRWIWRIERFPYPIWQFRRFRLFHERELFAFYDEYKDCMADIRGIGEKEFFNYCKTAIVHGSMQQGVNLKDEIHNEEATVRFFAGLFFAIRYSLLLIFASLAIHAYSWISYDNPVITSAYIKISQIPRESIFLHFSIALFLVFAFLYLKHQIVRRFRTLRMREVDTVYNAFYLINQKRS